MTNRSWDLLVSIMGVNALFSLCVALIAITACASTTADREMRLVACEAEADAYKILRGKRECLEKGVPFAGCDKEQDIKEEHRKALIKCQE